WTRLVVTPLMFRIWLNDTEQTIMIMIMEVVHAVARIASNSLATLRVANRLHISKATTQPTAAASVGVATPVIMSPMMEIMINTNGSAFRTSCRRTAAVRLDSAVGGGASEGLSFTLITT